jgi:hypothetical protein
MWVNNDKMDLREIGWGGTDWIDLAQDGDQWRALMNTVMNLRVPTKKFLNSCTTGGFLKRAQLHEVRIYFYYYEIKLLCKLCSSINVIDVSNSRNLGWWDMQHI